MIGNVWSGPRRVCLWASAVAACGLAFAANAPSATAAVEWTSDSVIFPTHLTPGKAGQLLIAAGNKGTTDSSGPITLTIQLPAGTTSAEGTVAKPGDWSCSGLSVVTCITPRTIVKGALFPSAIGAVSMSTELFVSPSASGTAPLTVTISGGGAAQSSVETKQITYSPKPLGFGITPGSLMAGAFDEAGNDYTQAGGHPPRASANFELNGEYLGEGVVRQAGGQFRDVIIDLPPGFLADPTAVARCTEAQFDKHKCPPESQIGMIDLFTGVVLDEGTSAIYNMEPPANEPAQFAFYSPAGPIKVQPSIRSDGDYGVRMTVRDVSEAGPTFRSNVTIWGYPMEAEHEAQRCPQINFVAKICNGVDAGSPDGSVQPGTVAQPSTAAREPFLITPVQCATPPQSTVRLDSWLNPVADLNDDSDPKWFRETIVHPQQTGCELVPFAPTIDFEPTVKAADSPTGLNAHLHVPREKDDEPDGLVQSYLKKATFNLPEGLTFNSGVADGLATCTPAQIGLRSAPGATPIRFDNAEPSCPAASKVGTGEVISPLLENHLHGEVFLAAQKANPFGSNFGIYLVIREPSILVKLAGRVEPDPATGQIKVTFDQNPQLPFEDFFLHFHEGPRAALATPITCGTFTTQTAFVPWSAADPDNPQPSEIVNDPDPFTINSSPTGSCVSSKAKLPFDIGLSAGSRDPVAGARSPFSIRVTRPDANQELERLEISPPLGFTGTLKGVPYCSESQIAAAISRESGRAEQQSPSCPAASQVGTTNVGAGAGPKPFYAPGKVYLSGPYKGEKLSVTVITPAVAGPFDLGNVVVRSVLKLDPRTAQITAVTDALPKTIEGVPLRVKDIRIDLDRPEWAINPTSCEEKQVKMTAFGSGGAVSTPSNRYQLGGCRNLGFKPKLSIRFKGGTKRGDHPALIAKLTTRKGDANIARAAVTLPRSAFLDQSHIRTICTRVQFAAEACPKGAVYGRTSVITPLLDDPLVGNVILRSSDNKLPDLVGDLKGVADIEAVGRLDSIKGGIRNTFDIVPDAPFDSFTLSMQGGSKGLVINSQNLCGKAHRATVKLTAHNGRTYNFRPKVVAVGCEQGRKGKRAARKPQG